jgi:hypothetical protein
MPLSKPAARKLMHTRDIRCHGYQRDDGLWDIEGRITDTKAYTFANDGRGGISAGDPLHDMLIRLTVDDDMVIQEAEASTDSSPFSHCGDVTPNFAELKGLKIGAGWRRAVQERMGRALGCTHLVDMLLGPVAVTAFQTLSVLRRQRTQDVSQEETPQLLNTCHAFASDGPVVKRRWPRHYTGT